MSFNPKVRFSKGQVQQIPYTPASTAVKSGDIVVIGTVAYFAEVDIAVGQLGALTFSGGVWAGNKATGTFNFGDPVLWNPTGTPVVGTASSGAFNSTTGTFCGYCVPSPANATPASGDPVVYFVKASGNASNVAGVAGGYKIARGQATTVTAADTIATGLATVISVVASLESDPTDDPFLVTAQVGDQSAAPIAGSIIIKTWKNTGGTDPTPLASVTFSKKVNWIAVGT